MVLDKMNPLIMLFARKTEIMDGENVFLRGITTNLKQFRESHEYIKCYGKCISHMACKTTKNMGSK